MKAGIITPFNGTYTLGVISGVNQYSKVAIDTCGRVAIFDDKTAKIRIYDSLELKYSWEFRLR